MSNGLIKNTIKWKNFTTRSTKIHLSQLVIYNFESYENDKTCHSNNWVIFYYCHYSSSNKFHFIKFSYIFSFPIHNKKKKYIIKLKDNNYCSFLWNKITKLLIIIIIILEKNIMVVFYFYLWYLTCLEYLK